MSIRINHADLELHLKLAVSVELQTKILGLDYMLVPMMLIINSTSYLTKLLKSIMDMM